MLPHQHALISVAVGAAGWWWTGDPTAGAVALAAGLLPDLDHAADYAYYRRTGEHRLILPLHGYEYALPALGTAAWTGNSLLAVGALSYLLHLLADQWVNYTHRPGYWLIYRAWHGFRIDKISRAPAAAKQGRVDDMAALQRLLNRPRALLPDRRDR